MARILVTGSLGQIGTELIPLLESKNHQVVSSDIRDPVENPDLKLNEFVYLDVTKENEIDQAIKEHEIEWIIHNASILSAKGERNPQLTLQVNIRGIENMLKLARKFNLRLYAPSSIAAFGPSTPKYNTPDLTIMRPTTMYGITKVYTELMGEYYDKKYGIDFRSLRYPGIISSVIPGGGATDYAVDIFYQAIQHKEYTSFLKKDEELPMMYIPDCLNATITFLEADKKLLTQQTYNITAMSFTPSQLAEEIKIHIPEFEISYQPDYRQKIAETWPKSIDDSQARLDWGWSHKYDLKRMTADMIEIIEARINIGKQFES